PRRTGRACHPLEPDRAGGPVRRRIHRDPAVELPAVHGFVAVGGLAKYAVLLYLVFVIGVAYDPRTARSITFVLVVVVVAMSVLGSWLYRRRSRGRKAR